MLIAGFQPMTLMDYPGKIAALIFTQGCNFACGYCHNPEMIPVLRVLPNRPELDPENILNFLKKRKGLLDGVVISGGEPTLQPDLVSYLSSIKSLGFLVKLDTNGSKPNVLEQLFKDHLVDYIALDIKHQEEKYDDLVKCKTSKLLKSAIELIRSSGVPYEFRSTILPLYHREEDITAMGKMIEGAPLWALQNFRPLKTLDRRLQKERSFRSDELKHLAEIAKNFAGKIEIRDYDGSA